MSEVSRHQLLPRYSEALDDSRRFYEFAATLLLPGKYLELINNSRSHKYCLIIYLLGKHQVELAMDVYSLVSEIVSTVAPQSATLRSWIDRLVSYEYVARNVVIEGSIRVVKLRLTSKGNELYEYLLGCMGALSLLD